MRPIKKGSVDQSVVIRIIDSLLGTPETGVVAATTGLALNYRRESEAAVAITTINNLALLTTAHTDGGILHIGDGYYRVDFQDTAFAVGSGENGVLLTGTATGMIVIGAYVPLVDYDPYDTVRLGLTSLPNAVVDAAGGLVTSAGGATGIDDLATPTNITAGTITTVTTNTDMRGTDGANTTVPDAAGVCATQAEVATEVQAGLVANNLDHLCKTAVANNADMTTEVIDGTVLSNIMSSTSDTSTFTVADDSLQGISEGAAGGGATAAQIWDYDISGVVTADFAGTVLQDRMAETSISTTAGAVDNVTLADTVTTYTGNTKQTADHTAGIADIPTTSELALRTLLSAEYTVVGDLGTVQTADHTAAIADIPTIAEFEARSIVSADYVVVGDTIAGVTLVDTVTTVTGGATSAAQTTAQNDLDIITGATGVNLLNATQASIDAIEVDTSTTIPGTITTVQTDLDTITGSDGATLATSQTLYAPAKVADLGTVQTGDTYPLASGSTGFTAIDTVVDAVKVVTDALTSVAAAKLALSSGTIVAGAAEAGTLATTQMTSDLTEATDDHYIGRIIIWTSGVLQNQATDITDYSGATGLLTFTATTEAPTAADTFIIV